jgi:hypothetical protein
MPLDLDNDLVIINDAITPAVGLDHVADRTGSRSQRIGGARRAGRNLAGRQ